MWDFVVWEITVGRILDSHGSVSFPVLFYNSYSDDAVVACFACMMEKNHGCFDGQSSSTYGSRLVKKSPDWPMSVKSHTTWRADL